MEQKDYLMRYFEQLGIVLAALLGFRKKRDGKGGLQAINGALKEMIGLDSQAINAIPEDQLVSELTGNSNLLPDQVKFIAEMLFQEAEFYGMDNMQEEAMHRYRKAYRLHRYIDDREKTWSQERTERMQLLERITGMAGS